MARKKPHRSVETELTEINDADRLSPRLMFIEKQKSLKILNNDPGFSILSSYGLLGPSGSGKTTLLRCILGRKKPKEGLIRVLGQTPGRPEACIPGPGVGYMPQELTLYPELEIQETLQFFGKMFDMPDTLIRGNESLRRFTNGIYTAIFSTPGVSHISPFMSRTYQGTH